MRVPGDDTPALMSRPSSHPPGTRLLLLGAGHAHLHLLRKARSLRSAGFRVTVVDPGDFWYSGAATGALAGLHEPGSIRVDVARLAAAGGVRRVRDTAVGADRDAREVRLASGCTLGYDVLSVNVGSVPRRAPEGAAHAATGVKPVRGLLDLAESVRRAAASGEPLRAVVLGGGPSGCEVALALLSRARREGATVEVVLLTEGEILDELPKGARASVRRVLEGRNVDLREDTTCLRVEEGEVVLDSGRTLPAGIVVDATGLVPAPAARTLGVPVDDQGAIRVDASLRSIGDPRIFAVGDCARFGPRPLARVGVHAVRQAPVLLDNLVAMVEGRPLRPYRPRPTHLLILALGEGTGLATWGPLWWRGTWALRLKEWIDRRFLRRHTVSDAPQG